MTVAFCCVNGFNIILYDLSYLEKMPQEFFCQYKGQDEIVKCIPEDFCGNPNLVSYEPNMELDDSFKNWVTQMDLACSSQS